MSRIKLKKVLRDPQLGLLLQELGAALGCSFAIVDPQERPLWGEAGEGARLPIQLAGQTMGWLVGDAAAAPLRGVLEHALQEEARRKAMAGEVLDAYREITLLYKLSQRLTGALKLQDVVEVALEEAGRTIACSRGEALLFEADGLPRCLACHGGPAEVSALGEAVARHALQSGKSDICNARAQDARFASIEGSHSLLWAPFGYKERVLGVLLLSHADAGNQYTAADLSLLTTIASQTAPAIENARLYEDLERLVTERTEELSKAKELAESASYAKSQFLANMSHELRTPLNALLGYAQILKRDSDISERQREGLDVIQRSGEHLLTLIKDLLDLSRIEVGKIELETCEFSLVELLSSLVDLFRSRVEGRELRFRHVAPELLPSVVRGDATKLRQVLMNLLSNAIKFTDKGSVVLRVTASGPRNFLFEVEDTGIGIAGEDLAHIFSSFWQVAQAGRSSEGTGLGLAICDNLVRIMGGELQVSSELGKGSKFWFDIELPAVQGRPTTRLPPLRRAIQGYRGARRKVLIVEDRRENRAVLVGLLEPLGFLVSMAEDGIQGLARVAELRPDLVLMDLVMPELDGFETIRRLRSMPEAQDLRIVALSASVFERDRKRSLSLGADAFIPKPVRADELLQTLQEQLQLEWVYAEPEPRSVTAQDSTLRLPAVDYLQPLYDCARRGHVRGVRAAIEVVRGLPGGFEAFVERMAELARAFQLKEICALLEEQADLGPQTGEPDSAGSGATSG